ncbi:protein S100-A1-like [Gouania willdenowi]|uniref:protein S100-A1-like n=1 Tax=Gouania willdenowi TaxID=441366 RepID=UPI001054BC94|nr:protein S100-A1-like [Gouania willdenowi]
MSELMTALETVMKIYDEYAAKDEKTSTLTKDEAKQLIQDQLGERFEADPELIFKDLDENEDDEVNFAEFGRLVFSILHAIHKK